MNLLKVVSGLMISLAVIGSVFFIWQLTTVPEGGFSSPSLTPDKTGSHPEILAANLAQKSATEVAQKSNRSAGNTIKKPPQKHNPSLGLTQGVKGFAFAGNAQVERSPEQIATLDKELELWEIMMSSEYTSYSEPTLISLAEQGDPVAFHQLVVNGEITIDDMQRLAKQLGQQGYPMIYGFAADGIFGATNDKILAMAYYMAAVNHGSELMRQFELDYQVWFKLEDDELALAAELATEL